MICAGVECYNFFFSAAKAPLTVRTSRIAGSARGAVVTSLTAVLLSVDISVVQIYVSS